MLPSVREAALAVTTVPAATAAPVMPCLSSLVLAAVAAAEMAQDSFREGAGRACSQAEWVVARTVDSAAVAAAVLSIAVEP